MTVLVLMTNEYNIDTIIMTILINASVEEVLVCLFVLQVMVASLKTLEM